MLPEGRSGRLVRPPYEDISQTRATGDHTCQELRETLERFINKYIAIGFDDDFPPFSHPKYREEVLDAEFGYFLKGINLIETESASSLGRGRAENHVIQRDPLPACAESRSGLDPPR